MKRMEAVGEKQWKVKPATIETRESIVNKKSFSLWSEVASEKFRVKTGRTSSSEPVGKNGRIVNQTWDEKIDGLGANKVKESQYTRWEWWCGRKIRGSSVPVWNRGTLVNQT